VHSRSRRNVPDGKNHLVDRDHHGKVEDGSLSQGKGYWQLVEAEKVFGY